MNIQAVRRAVMDLYPNATWHRKVHSMPDNQVFAIYRSRAENPKKPAPQELGLPFWDEPKSEPYHQIDIWEYLNEKGGTH